MNRFLALLLVVTMVAGCRSRATPLSNPFLAPDRVPPPATRMPAPGTAVPYYDNGQSVAPPVIQPGSGAQGMGSGTYSPGAAIVPRNGPSPLPGTGTLSAQDVLPPSSQPVRAAVAEVPIARGISIPTDDRAARLAVRPVETTAPQPPERTPTLRPSVRFAATPPVISSGCCPPYGQGVYPNAWQTVEISELPPVGVRQGQLFRSAASGDRSMEARRGGSSNGRWNRPSLARRSEESGVRLASAERSAGSDQLLTTAADATPRTRARYGIGPQYEWLKGRLERSAATGQWKLRYIPIDGATDDYGGSVVVDNPRTLGDFDAGDFVKIYGSLDSGRSDDVSFAASYRVTSVRPLAE